MTVGSDGLVNSDLPRDKNLFPLPVANNIQIQTAALTGAGGVGDTFSIAVPDGAMQVRFYILDSSNALLAYTIDDIQGSPNSAFYPTTNPLLIFGCAGHATIAGSVGVAELANAATATAIAIFDMGRARG